MSKYIKESSINVVKQTSNIRTSGAYHKVKDLSFQKYFESIIIPQLPGYFDTYPVQFNYKPVVCCPLHDEDTPSFRFYEETNSFYCFGCQTGGDIVELHRDFIGRMSGTKPTRDEAIKFLYNYFIEGKETTELNKTQEVKQEKINSDSDIVKLNLYRIDLEQSISFDNSISLSDKKEMWEVLDNVDILISKDLIKASDAKKIIQKKYKEIIETKLKEQYKIKYNKNRVKET